MKPFTNKIVIFAFLCCALVAGAEDKISVSKTPVKDYPACFAAWDKNMDTLQTRFTQTTEYDGMQISQSQGRITYTKTGPKLRLDNLEEDAISQTALTDKKQIYILDDKGKEISKILWADWLTGQPNQALFDFGNYTQLLAKHTVNVKETNDKQAVLQLIPKISSENYVLYVTIDTHNCFPGKITIESDLMQTSAVLSDVRLNTELPKDLFKGLK